MAITTTATGKKSVAATEPDHSGLLALARDRFSVAMESESLLRQEQLKDKRFRAGQQWEEKDRERRAADKRPTLTVNRLPQFIKQITGQLRAARPAIQVNPVDDAADPETAEVLQGIIRHIEARSHAPVAYDQAVDDQVTMGRGYIRLITEPLEDDPFTQEIKIKRVRNPHSVTYDPSCVEPDYSDGTYGFVSADLSRVEFTAKHPKHKDVASKSEESWNDLGNDKHLWLTDKDTIRVAEYFYVEYEDIEWARLADGRTMPLADAQELIAKEMAEAERLILAGQEAPPINEILAVKKGKKRVVKWAKLCGLKVLETGLWAGKWIPIVPVLGDEIDLDGKIDLRGIVRDARDQQRIYNFQVSALVEAIALAPRAPWVIAAGQLDGFEKYWKTSNQKSWAFLPYKATKVGDIAVPPPQRQTFEPAIQAIVAAIQQADNDLKATTGLYDASLGERGPEQSGKAILARQKQGEVGNVHFGDNLARAQWAIGRQLIDLIPKIYDVPRVLRITGLDDQQKQVMVHAGNGDAVPQDLPRGVKKAFDLSVGTYDVVVTTGPSHSTRRQEAVEMMAAAIQANPELMGIMGDLYFGMMDWPGARPIQDRLRKALPPQLQPPGEDGGPSEGQLQAQVAQQEQAIQELTEALEQAQFTLETKQIEVASKENLELMKHTLEIARMELQLAQARQSQMLDLAVSDHSENRKLAHDREKTRMTLDAGREKDQRAAHLKHADTVLAASREAATKLFESNLSRQERAESMVETRRQRREDMSEREQVRKHESTERDKDRKAAKAKPSAAGAKKKAPRK